MAKDFYRMNEDGSIEHVVVMGMTNYEKYRSQGWTNRIPRAPSRAPEDINPFEGIEDDEDTPEEIKAKAREILKKRASKKAEKAVQEPQE